MAKLQANLIIEILGRPAEHIKEALNTLVIKMGSEKGVEIIEKTYHDPKPVENSEDLFTAFAEATIELDSLDNYFAVIFTYMPAHIELINPEKVTHTNNELNEIGNKILARLHEYDSITKTVINERDIMAKELKKYAPHMFQKSDDKEENIKKIEKK